ncbi:hypothetical protein IFM89_000512 [Coptis chinensis]|uniref:Uncharacterized protein n=1 Tax=Coptis chinensis TaxID=261450 RepID=A0A835H3H1_9MAGN|nr:hypothetical protein IFM89_000512 [Coptis chinensis]
MIETLHYPFEMCVKEGYAASLMCSYNRVNGVPACAHPKLLNETIRGLWDLHGLCSKYGVEGILNGKVAEAKLDEALKNLYAVLMRLGWFDGSPGNYGALGRDDICSPASLELAAESGVTCRYVTPLVGLGSYADVKYAPGCTDVKCKSDLELKATQ